jgi:hypothetical protein
MHGLVNVKFGRTSHTEDNNTEGRGLFSIRWVG